MQAKMPRIAFVQGEMERSIDKIGDRHYKLLTNDITFRYSLVNQGFDVETLFLKDQDIPGDITALVIADPKVAFDTVSLAKIRTYIAAGGNLLIAGEPGKQAILNPLLQPLGVQLVDGMVVEQSKDFSPELVQPFLTPAAEAFTRRLKDDAEDSLPLSMKGVAAITYGNDGPFTVSPLAMTVARTSWNKKVRPDEDLLESAEGSDDQTSPGYGMPVMFNARGGTPVRNLAYSPAEGDQPGPLPVIVGLTRTINGKQQRIIVSGDADFLSNAELGRHNVKTCNFDFSTAMFSWFDNGEFPVDSYRPPSRDTRLDMTEGGFSFLKVLLLSILPGLLLVIGAVLLVRRKRK
jgi:ABC-2 type transport system permease protein